MRTVWASILLLLAACGDSGPGAPPFPPGDGSVQPPAGLRLTLESPAELPITLGAGESLELVFSVRRVADDEPEAGAVISCTPEGAMGELAFDQVFETDASGEARVTLGSGGEPAFVSVRCFTPRAVELSFEIAVSPSEGFGALLVGAAYEGARDFQSVRVEAHYERSCDASESASPASSAEAGAGELVRLEPVPVELSLTVLVSLLDSRGAPVARGCVEGVSVTTDELEVMVPVHDLPLEIAGEYRATLRVRSPGAPSIAGAAGRTVAFAELSAFGGEVDYMLAALRAGLVARNFEVDLITLDADISENYAFELSEAYAIDGVSPELAVFELEDLASGSSGALELEGVLSIAASGVGTYGLTFTTETLSAGPSFASLVPLPLASFSGDPIGTGSASGLVDASSDAALGFGFGGGAIVAAGVRATLEAPPEEALFNLFGCDTFVGLPLFEGTFVECEEACREEICSLALARVVDAYFEGVEGAAAGSSIGLEARLRFEGAGPSPESIAVEELLARAMDGASVFEVLEAELTLAR